MEAMLSIKNLTKKYGSLTALDDFSYDFSGGVYGILGPNGAGKSTFLNLLTDNIKRSAGEILFRNEEILKMGSKYRNHIGYMPQQCGLYEDFCPYEFLLYMAALKGIPKRTAKDEALSLLDEVNLLPKAFDRIKTFSGGMKQRVHLANALLGNPDILILDEPTAGLDPSERVSVRNLIASLAENRIILYSTHVVSDIESVSEQVLLLKSGKLVGSGSSFELINGISGHVYECRCTKDELPYLRGKYPVNNVRQSSDGLRFRVVQENRPDGFDVVGDNLTLEDVYLYMVVQ